MCIVWKSDINLIGAVILKNLFINTLHKVPFEEMEDNLKDYLADLKEKKVIEYCGCDNQELFKLEQDGKKFIVYFEILNVIHKFVINIDKTTVKESVVPYSETMSNYDGWQGDDYLDF